MLSLLWFRAATQMSSELCLCGMYSDKTDRNFCSSLEKPQFWDIDTEFRTFLYSLQPITLPYAIIQLAVLHSPFGCRKRIISNYADAKSVMVQLWQKQFLYRSEKKMFCMTAGVVCLVCISFLIANWIAPTIWMMVLIFRYTMCFCTLVVEARKTTSPALSVLCTLTRCRC